jgi:hypothetical protein
MRQFTAKERSPALPFRNPNKSIPICYMADPILVFEVPLRVLLGRIPEMGQFAIEQ